MIDSHCHLDRLDLTPYDGNLETALAEARTAGVSRFLCIGINLDSASPLLEIAGRHKDVDLSIGLHPLDDVDALDFDALKSYAERQEFVAVGETGLDYYYSPDNKMSQTTSFIQHLRLGAELDKPMVVHSRDAPEDTLQLIGEHGGSAGGVMHCFTGDWSMASAAIEMGYYISFSGIVTFRNAETLREVASQVPADRILIETDSPWLAPVPYRGRPNESKYLPAVAECVAKVRGESLEAIIEQTSENYYRLFKPTKI